MSDILFAAVPIHGHVAPLLPVARSFVARGDRVRFLTGSRFAEVVARTGAEHIALPAAADFDDRELTSAFPERRALSPVKAIAFDFEHIFVRPGEHQFTALRALLDEPTDVIVCDPLFVGAAILVEAEPAERVPVVVAGVVPLSYPGPGLAPFGLGLPPLGGPAGRLRNGALAAMTRRLFRPVEAAAAEVSRRVQGRPLSGPVLDWMPRADAVCQLTVASFEYPRPDAPDTLVFCGPVVAAAARDERLPGWWHELDGTRPVVHVTQGTIANADLGELVLPTIAALAQTHALVVVSTGGVPVEQLGALPDNVRASEFLPYDELFARTDVFVTNGGYGGTQFALGHGVPVVVAPGKEDKVEVAARIAWSGAGVNLKTQQPSPRRLRAAVLDVLADPRYRAAAARIGADIRASTGTETLAATVDQAIARHTSRSLRSAETTRAV